MSFKLNPLFSDNLVFAKGRPVRVFGEGDCDVTVSFLGETKTVSCENGKFLCELSVPTEYGGPYELKVTAEGRDYIFSNVYVGEVFIAAGQSNFQFKVWQSKTEKDKVFPNDKLRFFMLERIEKKENEDKENKEYAEGEATETIFPEDGWVLHKKENLGQWTLLGTRIAELIAERKDCVCGIIGCYQGASVIESWLPKELCNLPPYDIPVENKGAYGHATYPCLNWNTDGRLYEFMWSKLLPFSVNSFIWYQGESDAHGRETLVYDIAFKNMVERYREDMLYPDMPVVIVQLPDFNSRNDVFWKNMQEAQKRCEDIIDNCICVESTDLCEHDDIHPPTKIHLAKRIVDKLGY